MNVRRALFLFLGLVGLLVVVTLWRADPFGRRARMGVRERLPHTTKGAARRTPLPPARTTIKGLRISPEDLSTSTGRVVWRDGSPVAGAVVELTASLFDRTTWKAFDGAIETVSRTRCDDDGRFLVRWIPGLYWRCTVASPDGVRRAIDRPWAEDDNTIVLDNRPAQIDVEVVRDPGGAPLPNATVEIVSSASGTRAIRKTDARGRCRVAWRETGWVTVTITPRDGERVLGDGFRCEPGQSYEQRHRIGLGLTVRGEVVDDATGAPVTGALVYNGHEQLEARTDAEGKFGIESFPWEPGTSWFIHVDATGYARWHGAVGRPALDGETEQITMRLIRGTTLHLRCVDANGSPRGDLLVIANAIDSDYFGTRSWSIDSVCGVTDRNGLVTLGNLADAEAGEVRIFLDGALVRATKIEKLGTHEERDLGTYVIADPIELRGVVRRADGRPATGSIVHVVPLDDEDWSAYQERLLDEPRRGSFVDGRGRFSARGVYPGLHSLRISGGNNPPLYRGIDIEPGMGEIEVSLPVEGLIRGRVVDRDGAPVPRATVTYGVDRARRGDAVFRSDSCQTDGGGQFVIRGFAEGGKAVRLYAKREGEEEDQSEIDVVPGADPVELRLNE